MNEADTDRKHDGSSYPESDLNERGAASVYGWMEVIEYPEEK
ncbi:hypothetical protein [Mesorhizobium sp. KR1-2]